jgi:archaellum component FlaC
MQYKDYKSPIKKLIRFFEISRDGWKDKYLTLKKDLKRFKNRIYDLEKRKENWKQEALNSREEIKSLQLKVQEFENIKPIKKN